MTLSPSGDHHADHHPAPQPTPKQHTLFAMIPSFARRLYKSGQSHVLNMPPQIVSSLDWANGDTLLVYPLPIGCALVVPPDYAPLCKHLIIQPVCRIVTEVPPAQLGQVDIAYRIPDPT